MFLTMFGPVVLGVLLLHAVSGMQPQNGKTSLLIIDEQNCFVPGGTLPVDEGDVIVPVINDLRLHVEPPFDLVVLTQDWHCSDHVSFASQHQNYSVYDTITLLYNDGGELCQADNINNPYAVPCTGSTSMLEQTMWPDHCVINTTDADFHPELIQEPTDVIIQKGYRCHVDSYSAFYDNGGFEETELRQTLLGAGISTLYLTGLATDYCLYWTAKDSVRLGFETYVVMDATRGIDPDTTEAAIEDMISLGVHLINSTDLQTVVSKSPVALPDVTITWLTVLWTGATLLLLI